MKGGWLSPVLKQDRLPSHRSLLGAGENIEKSGGVAVRRQLALDGICPYNTEHVCEPADRAKIQEQ
jgi:hypothetical protein